MSVIGTKKTLNLHKYNLKLNSFLSNWKIIIPIIFTILGIIIGCAGGKGESSLFNLIKEYFTSVILTRNSLSFVSEFLFYIILPSILLIIIFFLGLSVIGSLIANAVPFVFGYAIGCISFYLYNTYTLKGLAYCLIMIFPYCVLALLSIVICCRESVSMSEYILKSISKIKKSPNYGFTYYCKSFIRNYLFIIAAAGIKALLEYLFGGLFSF